MQAALRHELVSTPHALGAQDTALRSLHERNERHGDSLLGAWAAEYGALNRVLSLWGRTTDEPQGEGGDDWLAATPVRRALTVRRAFDAAAATAPLTELRLYAMQPGALEAFIAALLAALPHRERYSPCAGLWTTRERGHDVAVHLWPYASFDARLAARRRAQGDAEWNAYRASIRPLVLAMQAALLVPLPLPR